MRVQRLKPKQSEVQRMAPAGPVAEDKGDVESRKSGCAPKVASSPTLGCRSKLYCFLPQPSLLGNSVTGPRRGTYMTQFHNEITIHIFNGERHKEK